MDIGYIKKIAKELRKNDIDCIFLLPSAFLEFLIGKSLYLCHRFQGLFITKDEDVFYICPSFLSSQMGSIFNKNVYSFSDDEDFTDIVGRAFSDFSLIGKNIAVTKGARLINWLKIKDKIDINIIDGDFILDEVKVIKGSREILYLKKTAGIVDEAFEYVLNHIKPGIYEKDIRDKILEYFKMKNVEPAFIPIIASGENSSIPHYNKYDRRIGMRDNIVMNFGCIYKGLCLDISRSIFIGSVTKTQEDIYHTVLEANLASEDVIKDDTKVSIVDRYARRVINESGYNKFFTTRLGHGVGYSLNEAPIINQSNNMKLKRNMVLSIEPGIYIKDEFGVKIGDTVIVEKDRSIILNKAKKDLIVL